MVLHVVLHVLNNYADSVKRLERTGKHCEAVYKSKKAKCYLLPMWPYSTPVEASLCSFGKDQEPGRQVILVIPIQTV